MGDLGHEHSHALGNPLLRVPVGTHVRDQAWVRSGHLTKLQAALDNFLCQFLVDYSSCLQWSHQTADDAIHGQSTHAEEAVASLPCQPVMSLATK